MYWYNRGRPTMQATTAAVLIAVAKKAICLMRRSAERSDSSSLE
jgi:hypothetical protein